MLGIRLNLFAPIIKLVGKAVKFAGKIKFTDIILDVVAYIPTILRIFNDYKEKQKDGFTAEEYKEFIDMSLQDFDNATGLTGLDVIPNLPQDKEEIALDHLKEFMRIILYCQAGVKGYTSNAGRKIKSTTTGSNEKK